MSSIQKTITLDPRTSHISKAASKELQTPESTIIRYFFHCFEHEPLATFSMIKQRLGEPSTREAYLSEMQVAMHKFIVAQQLGIRVCAIGSDKLKRSIQAPSGRRYSFGPQGIKVTDPIDIEFFKQQEAGSGFKVVDAREDLEAEE